VIFPMISHPVVFTRKKSKGNFVVSQTKNPKKSIASLRYLFSLWKMLMTEENGSTASLILRQESAVSQWLSTICPLQVADEVA
jgi:hypothetical protein